MQKLFTYLHKPHTELEQPENKYKKLNQHVQSHSQPQFMDIIK